MEPSSVWWNNIGRKLYSLIEMHFAWLKCVRDLTAFGTLLVCWRFDGWRKRNGVYFCWTETCFLGVFVSEFAVVCGDCDNWSFLTMQIQMTSVYSNWPSLATLNRVLHWALFDDFFTVVITHASPFLFVVAFFSLIFFFFLLTSILFWKAFKRKWQCGNLLFCVVLWKVGI